MALLYWPGGEFMYLVLTTSTGEAITVVTKPAPNADTKWHGRLSVGGGAVKSALFLKSSLKQPKLTGHRSLQTHANLCIIQRYWDTFMWVNMWTRTGGQEQNPEAHHRKQEMPGP